MNAAQLLVDLDNEQLRLSESVALDVGEAAGVILAMDALGMKVEWNPGKKAYKLF